MSLLNSTETASWLEVPPLGALRGIRHLFTQRIIDLLRAGTLFDGALVSDIGEPLMVPKKFLPPRETELALIYPTVKGRLTVFNPGTSRIFFDPFPIYRGSDVAVAHERGGFQIQSHIQLVNEGFMREVSHTEALSYIGFPCTSLVRGKNFTPKMESIFSGGFIYQVTKKGAGILRLVRRGYSDNGSTGFSGGGGFLEKPTWLPV